jgi:hypothetical protein
VIIQRRLGERLERVAWPASKTVGVHISDLFASSALGVFFEPASAHNSGDPGGLYYPPPEPSGSHIAESGSTSLGSEVYLHVFVFMYFSAHFGAYHRKG